MTTYSDKYHKKSKEEIEEYDPVVIGDEYNDDDDNDDNNNYEQSAYEVRESSPIKVNKSITSDERDGDREHLVAEVPDPNEDYYRKREPPFRSGLDSLRHGTIRITSETVTGGDGKILYSYKEDSGYSNSRDATGGTKGRAAPRPYYYKEGEER